MPQGIVTNVVYINYGLIGNLPAGGFRFFYNPDVDATYVDASCPSIPIGVGDENVTNETGSTRLRVQLPITMPMIPFIEGQTSRTLLVAVAPVNANGEVGTIGAQFSMTVTGPTINGTFTVSSS